MKGRFSNASQMLPIQAMGQLANYFATSNQALVPLLR